MDEEDEGILAVESLSPMEGRCSRFETTRVNWKIQACCTK